VPGRLFRHICSAVPDYFSAVADFVVQEAVHARQHAQHERQPLLLQCSLDDKSSSGPTRPSGPSSARLPADRRAARDRPSLEKSIAPLRSFVAEPMRFGRCSWPGTRRHWPPTGAKGLNLRPRRRLLARALAEYYRGSHAGIDHYSQAGAGAGVEGERSPGGSPRSCNRFPRTATSLRMQQAEFDYLCGSNAAQTVLAENYVGLPLAEAGRS